jgi:GT2 family glycosyltransferase
MTGAAETPRIAVVVVTYNSTPVLADCLRSLEASAVRPVAVVVADNNSRDGSLAFAEQVGDLPLRTVQLGRNAGYSAAINAAVAALEDVKLDAIFVMNPDCRVRPDTLGRLAAVLREPGRGIAVPRITDPDGHTHFSLRRAPSVRGAFAEAFIGGTRAGRAGPGEVITDPAAYERPGRAVWATGAAMLGAAEAGRDIGPWDESFLLYSEETEYALRAGDRGWVLWYEPSAVVTHIGGEAKTNPRLAALLAVNKVWLFRRRRGRAAGSAYYAAMLLGEAIRAATGKRNSRAGLVALIGPFRRSRKLVD